MLTSYRVENDVIRQVMSRLSEAITLVLDEFGIQPEFCGTRVATDTFSLAEQIKFFADHHAYRIIHDNEYFVLSLKKDNGAG